MNKKNVSFDMRLQLLTNMTAESANGRNQKWFSKNDFRRLQWERHDFKCLHFSRWLGRMKGLRFGYEWMNKKAIKDIHGRN